MSWEGQKEAASVFAQSNVPEESIRLRILANSDSPQDQQIKRIIRDRVIAYVSQWAQDARDVNDARSVIRSHLPELQQLVRDTLDEKGFTYDSDVQLGPTEFPTKMYGTQVFPAGTYEAVLITLGNSEGRNWWCVMFPPLCFVDISSGDTAVQKRETQDSLEQVKTEEIQVLESLQEETAAQIEVEIINPFMDALVEDGFAEQQPFVKTTPQEEMEVNTLPREFVDSQDYEKQQPNSQVELRFFFIDKFKEIVSIFS